ncbi:thiol reductase thioredoxin [Tumebacillus algifaecis]|uniref:Thiol reductase thioredoxin n=1 Tax=Tumebacillus algifaecis TaxID=1214604 RepID=A0A223D6J4_9BACL|nr:thiol reductase thioredoxin [Tumebacillus algifaecis]
MKHLIGLQEVQAHLHAHEQTLLLIKTVNCGVCDVIYEKTERLLEQFPQVQAAVVSADESPSIAGEFLVFTAPTILLFLHGKEVHRQARFVLVDKVEAVLQALSEA